MRPRVLAAAAAAALLVASSILAAVALADGSHRRPRA